ncbi:MAG TPA: hypothetical protein VN240_10980 [Propylenella sp.]|nr:hypothetical protein [Propylenella sp.]
MTEGKGKPVPPFKRVLREVRIAHAERNDVIVELRETEQMRLQLLAEALEGVFDDLPDDYEQLLLGLLPGQPPRFWVDATSFVVMGRDKRQYQFVKDTRLGRTVLAESASLETIAHAVTRYVAERIVERDRAIEADWLNAAIRAGSGAVPGARAASPARGGDSVALVWAIAGFGLGMIAGMVLLVAYAWFTVG